MLPALPLDGAACFASVWRWTDDRRVATTVGAGAGRALAIVMIVGGLGLTFAGAGAGGIWFAFLGWFLLQAATAERRQGVLRGALGDLRVDDLMVHRPVTVPADATLSGFMDEVAHVHRYTTYPVVDDGHLVGLLPFARVAATPRAGWDEHRVRDCMMLLEDAPVVQTGGRPCWRPFRTCSGREETARSCSITASWWGCSGSPTSDASSRSRRRRLDGRRP